MKYLYLLTASLFVVACGNPSTSKKDGEFSFGPPIRPLAYDSVPYPDPSWTPAYDSIVSSVTGDLNKDGLRDSVIVTQNTKDSLRPHRLQIYFATNQKTASGKRKYKQIVTTDKAIEPLYPFGSGYGYPSGGTSFTGAEIKKGVLWLNNEWIRGHYEYKYRYQNGHFELIGYTSSGIGTGIYDAVDFNLVTGVRIHTEESIGERSDYDDPEGPPYIDSKERTKVLIRPLPLLETFEPNTDSRIE